MAKGDDTEERLINFAVYIVQLGNRFTNTFTARHIANQLLRCRTSPAAHYAEARGAESKRDFVHKLKLCNKELNEARVWIKIIIHSDLLPNQPMSELLQECNELCRITNASIKTAQRNLETIND